MSRLSRGSFRRERRSLNLRSCSRPSSHVTTLYHISYPVEYSISGYLSQFPWSFLGLFCQRLSVPNWRCCRGLRYRIAVFTACSTNCALPPSHSEGRDSIRVLSWRAPSRATNCSSLSKLFDRPKLVELALTNTLNSSKSLGNAPSANASQCPWYCPDHAYRQ